MDYWLSHCLVSPWAFVFPRLSHRTALVSRDAPTLGHLLEMATRVSVWLEARLTGAPTGSCISLWEFGGTWSTQNVARPMAAWKRGTRNLSWKWSEVTQPRGLEVRSCRPTNFTMRDHVALSSWASVSPSVGRLLFQSSSGGELERPCPSCLRLAHWAFIPQAGGELWDRGGGLHPSQRPLHALPGLLREEWHPACQCGQLWKGESSLPRLIPILPLFPVIYALFLIILNILIAFF